MQKEEKKENGQFVVSPCSNSSCCLLEETARSSSSSSQFSGSSASLRGGAHGESNLSVLQQIGVVKPRRQETARRQQWHASLKRRESKLADGQGEGSITRALRVCWELRVCLQSEVFTTSGKRCHLAVFGCCLKRSFCSGRTAGQTQDKANSPTSLCRELALPRISYLLLAQPRAMCCDCL